MKFMKSLFEVRDLLTFGEKNVGINQSCKEFEFNNLLILKISSHQHTICSFQAIAIFLVSSTNCRRFGQINSRSEMDLRVMVVLQQLLNDVLRYLQKLVNILE